MAKARAWLTWQWTDPRAAKEGPVWPATAHGSPSTGTGTWRRTVTALRENERADAARVMAAQTGRA